MIGEEDEEDFPEIGDSEPSAEELAEIERELEEEEI